MPRIYLAGPDVFRPDVKEHMGRLSATCARLGMEALLPSDGLAPDHVPDDEIPRFIYETNMAQLRRADGVIANLEPFRGAEPDSGTVFEVGAAVALGIPVVAYGVEGVYADRVGDQQRITRIGGMLRDQKNLVVEDFGLPLNLMLASSVKIGQSAEHALAIMAAILTGQGEQE
jgi:nucleoside 2-deoxyribosyltransferase